MFVERRKSKKERNRFGHVSLSPIIIMQQDNKERHFCFAYIGRYRMQATYFTSNAKKFKLSEGCREQIGNKTIQYIRISLHPNAGRRKSAIPRIIDEFNRKDGRVGGTEVVGIVPVIVFPGSQDTAVHCFKSTAPAESNPILQRIAIAKQKKEEGFWRWTATGEGCWLPDDDEPSPVEEVGVRSGDSNGGNHHGEDCYYCHNNKKRVTAVKSTTDTTASVTTTKMISVHDILLGMQLHTVPIHRVYDELSEPYFRKFGVPMGEGTGCVPLEHRSFIVSEIKRLFEEELDYIQQPSVVVAQRRSPVKEKKELPPHAKSLVEDAGWMGDILLSGDSVAMGAISGGPMIHAVRVENEGKARKKVVYVRSTEEKKKQSTTTTTTNLERRGVGALLKEFLVFYALQWNNAGMVSVSQSIESLYSGWVGAREDVNTLQSLLAGANLASYFFLMEVTTTEGSADSPVLRVPSVEKLLRLLCREGLIITVVASSPPPSIQRMTVAEDCTPVSSIVKYFQDLLASKEGSSSSSWGDAETVETTATDIVKVLNGGGEGMGVYRRSCVSQFMRPFIFDGSVEAYFWWENGTRNEKYVIHVAQVAKRIAR